MRRLVGLLALVVACDPTYVPPEPQLNVFCVLLAREPHTLALVNRTCPDERWSWPSEWQNGVASATVSITRGTDQIRFHPVPESAGYYLSDSLTIAPGATYDLTVECSDGKVSGSTTVPADFSVGRVRFDTFATRNGADDTLGVRVTAVLRASRGAAAYDVLATCRYVSQNRCRTYYYRTTCEGSDTARFSTPLHPADVVLWVLDTVRLTCLAMDRNYLDYRIMQREHGYRNTLMHLDGGLGVFGSVCAAETTVALGGRDRLLQPRQERGPGPEPRRAAVHTDNDFGSW